VETFSIINKTKGRLPSLPFVQIKDTVLGKKYVLNLVFVGKKTSQKLNNTYRQINKPTDILSFSLSKKEGEIFINPDKARKKAKEFGRKYDNYLAFLFIHGLYHLKGLDHGEKMEKAEAKIRRVFNI
jgi:rRNA maturation RNase YbeY